MSTYCSFAPGHPVHSDYHATEYGFPQRDETVLFERLCLEIMQAGLSWEIVLKRRDGMREAFGGWDVDTIAAMDDAGKARLLADEGHHVADAYGVWAEKSMYGKTYFGNERTTFIIDPDGKVAEVIRKVKPAEHDALVLAALEQASPTVP